MRSDLKVTKAAVVYLYEIQYRDNSAANLSNIANDRPDSVWLSILCQQPQLRVEDVSYIAPKEARLTEREIKVYTAG